MAEINTELMDRTLATIEANPEHWNQGTWRCSSGMCFAGWAITLAGRQWATENPDAHYSDRVATSNPAEWGLGAMLLPGVWNPVTHRYEVNDNKMVVPAEVVAARDLGISATTADVLFAPHNTLDDLREMVAAIKSGDDLSDRKPKDYPDEDDYDDEDDD